MKKVFITGGTGFIGRNLKEHLGDTYEIFAPASSELDLLDQNAVCSYLSAHGFDVVIHTATWNATRNSTKDLLKVLSNNLRMFFNLARCADYYDKMLYYGSGAEYDRLHYIPKMTEDYFDSYVPSDDYGFSKYVMAKYTETANNIYDLRLFGVFGKYEDWQIRFISNACCKAIWDLPITIKRNVFFDYLYIDDLVEITKWFIENKPKEKFYNICTASTYDLLTLAKKVNGISGKDLNILIKESGLGLEYSGDNTKLLSEIGGFAFSDTDECIYKLYSWYFENRELVDRGKLLYDK